MSHYCKLSLPSQPIQKDLLQELIAQKIEADVYTFVCYEVKKYLVPELYTIFERLEHIPEFFTCFGHNDRSTGVSYLHSDLIHY